MSVRAALPRWCPFATVFQLVFVASSGSWSGVAGWSSSRWRVCCRSSSPRSGGRGARISSVPATMLTNLVRLALPRRAGLSGGARLRGARRSMTRSRGAPSPICLRVPSPRRGLRGSARCCPAPGRGPAGAVAGRLLHLRGCGQRRAPLSLDLIQVYVNHVWVILLATRDHGRPLRDHRNAVQAARSCGASSTHSPGRASYQGARAPADLDPRFPPAEPHAPRRRRAEPHARRPQALLVKEVEVSGLGFPGRPAPGPRGVQRPRRLDLLAARST